MPDLTPRTSLPTKFLRGALVLILLAAFAFALVWLTNSGLLKQALEWIRDLGPWAPLAFLAIYIVAVLLSLPASIFTLGGGFVFGMWWGSVYVIVAATMAANLAFLTGRHFARDWMARKVASLPKFKAIDDAVAREGWKIVALVRLAPVFPFSLMSYAFGLTRVPLWEYFLANFTMLPSTLMYVYFGTLLGDLTEKIERPTWIKWTVAAVTIAVLLYVTRFAKRALSQKVS